MSDHAGAEIRKILIVRAGRGGDLIMITPAVKALLTAFPEAEFHLLTTTDGQRIMDGYSDRITRVLLYTRRFPRTLVRQQRLRREILAEGYDRVYIFEAKPHYRRWLRGTAPRIFATEGRPGPRHNAAWNLDVVAESLDHSIERGWVNLPVTEAGRAKARALLTDAGVAPAAKLVGLHPTYSGTGLPLFRGRLDTRHRMWPAESFVELTRILTARAAEADLKLALVVDALPEELRHVQPIVDRSGGALTLLAAEPDFDRYKGLLSLLDVLVTANTGPMHMAAALNTPMVALFSHWTPDDCGPYMDPDRYTILQAEDLSDGGAGLADIAPDVVAEAVLTLLAQAGRP